MTGRPGDELWHERRVLADFRGRPESGRGSTGSAHDRQHRGGRATGDHLYAYTRAEIMYGMNRERVVDKDREHVHAAAVRRC